MSDHVSYSCELYVSYTLRDHVFSHYCILYGGGGVVLVKGEGRSEVMCM